MKRKNIYLIIFLSKLCKKSSFYLLHFSNRYISPNEKCVRIRGVEMLRGNFFPLTEHQLWIQPLSCDREKNPICVKSENAFSVWWNLNKYLSKKHNDQTCLLIDNFSKVYELPSRVLNLKGFLQSTPKISLMKIQ